MNKSELIGRLRRRGVWTLAGKVRRRMALPICRAIHGTVAVLGARALPVNLVLKHMYDYRLIYVDPMDIELLLKSGAWQIDAVGKSPYSRLRDWYEVGGGWKSVRSHVSRNFHGRFIADGDWDARAKPMEILPVAYQLFHEGRRPEETDQYKKDARRIREARRIEAGNLAWTKGGSTIDELDEYYERLIDIYQDIRANGYQTQAEIGEEGSDEIRVCIDRKGRLCVFGGGTHRLSIAKLLDLDRIPVILKCVHSAWVDDWKRKAETDDPIEAIGQGVARLEITSGP